MTTGIAGACLLLAPDWASNVTGQSISIDGEEIPW